MNRLDNYEPPEDLREKYGPPYEQDKNDIYMIILNAAMDRFVKCKTKPSSIELALYVIAKLGLDTRDVEPIEDLVTLATSSANDPQFVAKWREKMAEREDRRGLR